MCTLFQRRLAKLARAGYVQLPATVALREVSRLTRELTRALEQSERRSVLRSRGKVYGCRDLMSVYPAVAGALDSPLVIQLVREELGPKAGIVRALYFDKPPQRTWAVPLHRDRTIAVRKNDIKEPGFSKPTSKADVPHIEAPEELLAGMLTVRVHLDVMNEENGPLSVVPGSHLRDDRPPGGKLELSANAGDAILMRPLLSHSSTASKPGSTSHRRVLHFELAPGRRLPGELEWYRFSPLKAD